MGILHVLTIAIVFQLASAAMPPVCPAHEHFDCESRGGHLNFMACSTPYVRGYCPYMCGECDEIDRPPCAADPDCRASKAGCIWMGQGGSADFCARTQDRAMCSRLDCDACRRQQSLINYCPHKCGFC